MSGATGSILAISISTKKGVPKENVERADLIRDWGVKGDAHGGMKKRQVSILANESVEKMLAKGAKVRPGIFGENITTRDIDVPGLKMGQELRINQVVLKITKIGKECHKPCAIFEQVGDCVMPREGVFAQVIHGGEIRVGDVINL